MRNVTVRWSEGKQMTELAAFNRRDRLWHPPQYAPGYKTSVLRSPRRALLSLEMGSGEKTGPRFGHNAVDPLDNDMIRNGIVTGEPVGERVVVHGQVLDEFARPVRNTLLEVWQANAAAVYDTSQNFLLRATLYSICMVVSPRPRLGVFIMRSSARSSSRWLITLRYASASRTSMRS